MSVSPKEYIEANVGSWILADPAFSGNYEVLSITIKTSDHLDGFMSTIYMCDVVLQNEHENR